jgi:hypothetical protein
MSERAIDTSTDGLPLRAMYTLGELAKVSTIERRRLRRILEKAGVRALRVGKLWVYSLSDLQARARPLWEGIVAAEVLRQAADGL